MLYYIILYYIMVTIGWPALNTKPAETRNPDPKPDTFSLVCFGMASDLRRPITSPSQQYKRCQQQLQTITAHVIGMEFILQYYRYPHCWVIAE